MTQTLQALLAVMYREGKIRATNVTFIFWDLFYPLGYLLVFGVGIDHTLGFTAPSRTPFKIVNHPTTTSACSYPHPSTGGRLWRAT